MKPDILIIGHQWWWEVHYLAEARIQKSLRPTKFTFPLIARSTSSLSRPTCMHSFWIPALHGKVDLIPGHPNFIRIEASRAGTSRPVRGILRRPACPHAAASGRAGAGRIRSVAQINAKACDRACFGGCDLPESRRFSAARASVSSDSRDRWRAAVWRQTSRISQAGNTLRPIRFRTTTPIWKLDHPRAISETGSADARSDAVQWRATARSGRISSATSVM